MPLSRFFGLVEEEDLEAKKEYKAQLENQMLDIHSELENWHSKAGEFFETLLMDEQRKALADVMSAESDQQLLLARERARLMKKLLMRKVNSEEDLRKLREERNALEE